MPPKISVVLPVRNGENFIRQALDSVLSQDFQEFEILVGINPSTDSTLAITKSVLGSKHPGILVFKDEVSMPQNFNRTALLARGEYIKFLCHDDVLHFDSLRLLLSEFQQNSRIVLASSYESFLNEEKNSRAIKSFGKARYVGSIRSFYRFCKYGNWLGGPSGVMVNRKAFGVAPFDETLNCAFDMDCWINISRLGGIGIVPKALYSSRIHPMQGTQFCREGGFSEDLSRMKIKYRSSPNFALRGVYRLLG